MERRTRPGYPKRSVDPDETDGGDPTDACPDTLLQSTLLHRKREVLESVAHVGESGDGPAVEDLVVELEAGYLQGPAADHVSQLIPRAQIEIAEAANALSAAGEESKCWRQAAKIVGEGPAHVGAQQHAHAGSNGPDQLGGCLHLGEGGTGQQAVLASLKAQPQPKTLAGEQLIVGPEPLPARAGDEHIGGPGIHADPEGFVVIGERQRLLPPEPLAPEA